MMYWILGILVFVISLVIESSDFDIKQWIICYSIAIFVIAYLAGYSSALKFAHRTFDDSLEKVSNLGEK